MSSRVAIVDYGLGNLFSVRLACEHVGLDAETTNDRESILAADAVILPGVGAFGDAMDTLRRLDLVGVLQDVAASDKPLMGICLGLQLLMEVSYEFGEHRGLGIVPGEVVPIEAPREGDRVLKVPQIGWNRADPAPGADWSGTLLHGVAPGERFYFVHSYVVRPSDPSLALSTTTYGHIEFCSSLGYGSVFASQFHPERSGRKGLKIYHNLRGLLDSGS